MIELKAARYAGVDLTVTDFPTSGGNRLIKYRYPGSDKQAVERQGKITPTFNMTIVVSHEGYYEKRDAILAVLDAGKRATFTHPTFGDIENVICGPWSLTEGVTSLGRAEIAATFEVDSAAGVPQQSGTSTAELRAQSDALNAQLAADMADEYEVGTDFAGNFTDALDSVNDVSQAIADASKIAEPITSKIAAFNQTLDNFTGSVGSLIQIPADLAGEIGGLFEGLDTLFDTPAALLGAFSSLFSFGSDDTEIISSTVGLAQRAENRDIMRTTIRVQALGYGYVSAAEQEYGSTEALDRVQADLEAQYLDARVNQRLTNATAERLDRLRVQAQKTFDIVRVNTRSIITVETPSVPLSVLVYSYYGSTELAPVIAELNDVRQNAFVSGSVRMLTE